MPLYRNLDTDVLVDLPETVGEHVFLGARFERYCPDPALYEVDKVVDETAVSTQRLSYTATPIQPDLKDTTDGI